MAVSYGAAGSEVNSTFLFLGGRSEGAGSDDLFSGARKCSPAAVDVEGVALGGRPVFSLTVELCTPSPLEGAALVAIDAMLDVELSRSEREVKVGIAGLACEGAGDGGRERL